MIIDNQSELEKKALNQLLSGQNLFGKDGAFAPLLVTLRAFRNKTFSILRKQRKA